MGKSIIEIDIRRMTAVEHGAELFGAIGEMAMSRQIKRELFGYQPINEPETVWYVAYLESISIGFLPVNHLRTKSVIKDGFVKSDYRDASVYKRLLDIAIAEAKTRKDGKLRLPIIYVIHPNFEKMMKRRKFKKIANKGKYCVMEL